MKSIAENRLARFRARLQDQRFDTFMVLVEENRWYLSGFSGHDGQCDESAGCLFITAHEQLLATDSRYELQARNEAPEFEIYRYKNGMAKSLPEIVKTLKTERLGFESGKLSCLQFERLKDQLKAHGSPVTLVPTENLVEDLRIIKDDGELEAIRQSLALSEAAFETVVPELVPGITEKALAWTLEKAMRQMGAESMAFPPIVASGPNAALPHAVPTDRPIKEGEPVLFDWGARLNGYCSDISRTIVIGKPDKTFLNVYQIVRDAQRMAVEHIRPGISTQAVDKIAREHISDKGFAHCFGHGLGHGVGLATHEKPYLSPLRPTTLEAGMVTTVEPGIYIPEWGGVRLENMVVVSLDGATVLNTSSP